MKTTIFRAFSIATALFLQTSAGIVIDWVTVGNANNPPDVPSISRGGVNHEYRIGKYEVTNSQYVEFLNAVDPGGINPQGVFSSYMGSETRGGISFHSGAANGAKYTTRINMGDKPVNYVSWYDAARFANWLHNGQGSGATETGAYTLTGNTGLITKNAGAKVWIPSEDEWYKAAYYDPTPGASVNNYWLFATRSDTIPTLATADSGGGISNPGTNVANYNKGADWNGQDGNVTTVGSAGVGSDSHYGTLDQSGNVYEWTDAIISGVYARGVSGGSWDLDWTYMLSTRDRYYTSPWYKGYNVGFRVASSENNPPVADAGANLQIASSAQTGTVIQGTAGDPDQDALQYRWLDGADVLRDWTSVGSDGEANLPLADLPSFAIGSHTLTLEVSDSMDTVTDEMVLTVENSLPEVGPAPNYQIVEIGVDSILFTANVADYDGDRLSYEWFCEIGILDFGTVETPVGGGVVTIPGVVILPGDSRFGLGTHQVELRVNDGTNPPVSEFVTVNVTDTTQPSLSPLPDVTILWPPNYQLQPVVIQANAADTGGGSIHLSVQVSSSEPPDATIPDYFIDSVNDTTGMIELRLRSERSGKGPGRTYTVVVTAEDLSGNQSVASIVINAPHDKRKK